MLFFKKNTLFYFILYLLLFSCQENKEVNHFDITYSELIPNEKVPSTLTINKDEIIEGKIKHRGGSSTRFYKKSYTFKANEKISLIEGSKKYKKWILNASYIDKTLMRHKLCYELFKDFNEEHKIAQSKYITLSHNGNYQGIYLLMEKIGRKKLNADWKKGGFIFKDPPVFRKDTIQPQEKGNYHQQNYPKLNEINYNGYLDSLRVYLMTASNKELSANLPKLFDIPTIIDWQILLLFANNGDGVLKNFYLYRKTKNDKLKIVPWDYDHSFGRDADNEYNMMKSDSDWERNILLDRLYNDNLNNYQQKMATRWEELRKKGIITEDYLFDKIEEYKAIISPYIEANFKKWPYNSEFYFDSNTFEQELVIMKTFITKRIKMLDKFFNIEITNMN